MLSFDGGPGNARKVPKSNGDILFPKQARYRDALGLEPEHGTLHRNFSIRAEPGAPPNSGAFGLGLKLPLQTGTIPRPHLSQTKSGAPALMPSEPPREDPPFAPPGGSEGAQGR